MVIIELYKPRATHMKNRLNVQTCNCILGGDIVYACPKFQSEMISLKTFKKKNDVHWISDGTVIPSFLMTFEAMEGFLGIQGYWPKH